MGRAVLVSSDLFFGSKLSGAASLGGMKLETVGDVAGLRQAMALGDVRLVLLDLTLSGLDLKEAVAVACETRGDGTRVIAYGPHVQEEMLSAAREAGCDEVLTRGALNARLGEVFRG